MAARKERRQSRRIQTAIELSLVSLDNEPIGARACNLSAGGAYLQVERPLAPLSKLALDMEIPAVGEDDGEAHSFRLRADAIVVRCEANTQGSGGYNVGIAFLNMRPADRQRLEDYIEWRMTRVLLESAEASARESSS